MVDIHNHVLWALDDGAATLEASLAMLQTAAADGVTDIVATPHLDPQYTYNAELVRSRIVELAAKTDGHPRLYRGCEFHFSFDNIDHLLQDPTVYTINGTRYLLLEFPNTHIGRHTEPVLQRLIDAAIVPIVAHPERNPILRGDVDRLERWVELGCLVQVTALAITGGFGSPPRAASLKLLERGLVHVVASDAHDPQQRHPRLSEAYAAVGRGFGDETAKILFSENPRDVIEGLPIAPGKTNVTSSRRWWPF